MQSVYIHYVCVCVSSLLMECTWYCWWGCWKTTLFLCTTSSSPLRASNRRWLHLQKVKFVGQIGGFLATNHQYIEFPFCVPLRSTMWRLPLSWCRMEAWRNPKPDQKVFYRLYYIITRSDKRRKMGIFQEDFMEIMSLLHWQGII